MPNRINKKRTTLRQMRLVAIAALTVSLFILGAIGLMRIGVYSLGKNVREQIQFSVQVPDGYKDQSLRSLGEQIELLPGVRNLVFIDADSAARVVAAKIGQTPEEMLSLLGYNPMSSLFQFQLTADQLSTDSLQRLERDLEELGLSPKLSYSGDLLESVESNSRRIEWIVWSILIVGFIFSLVQINNTIRLGIYASRHQIRTLSLVGASSWFIRRPIVWRSLVDGLIASLLAIGLLAIVLKALEGVLELSLWSVLDVKLIIGAAIALIVVGLLACAVTALRASGKYIRMDGSKIHII